MFQLLLPIYLLIMPITQNSICGAGLNSSSFTQISGVQSESEWIFKSPSVEFEAAGRLLSHCPPDMDTCFEVYLECKRNCQQKCCPAATIDPCTLQHPCESDCECLFCV